MRDAFRYLTSLLFLAVVVQIGLAGYGSFNAIDKADKGHTITKKTIENGFDPHGLVGSIIGLVVILLCIAAVAGRVELLLRRLALLTLVLVALQFLFAYLGTLSAPLGFLHGLNAAAIYAATAVLAHRAWTRRATV